MGIYEFLVYDSDPADSHLWGSLRVAAQNEEEARTKAHEALLQEVGHGLVPPYTLRLENEEV